MPNLNFSFINNTSDAELKKIFNFNVKAFAESEDFPWTIDNIKNEIKDGWSVVSVGIEKDIVCALFIKEKGKSLLTKNTPIKLNHQGKGYSHLVKEFYENYAKDKGINTVINYCPADNFRMISLNEGHDYKKTGNNLEGSQNMLEWVKNL